MFAFSVLFCALVSCCWANNWIHEGSFEERSSRWQFRTRPNMWDFRPSQGQDVSYSAEHASSGSKSLRFFRETSPARCDQNLALVASQYLQLRNSCITEAPKSNNANGQSLKFGFHIRSSPKTSASARIDIRYTDRTFMFVRIDASEMRLKTNSFVRVCRFIPNYGMIESVLVSFILEPPGPGEEVYVDDVSLSPVTVDAPLESCPAYASSLPVRRHVERDFIRPALPRASGEDSKTPASITIATQLSVDRLSNLRRLVENWQGPVSAVLLVWTGQHSRQPPSKQISAVLEAVSESRALQTHLTLHLVFEDAMNLQDHYFYPVNYLRAIALREVQTQYVYYLDVDIMPAFNEATTAALVAETEQSAVAESSRKWALITPLLNMKTATKMPSSKAEALEWIVEGKLETFNVVSHSITNYRQWLHATSSFISAYRENVEPYFIVRSSHAPRMQEMFAGYGRDKCAYSREANGMGIEFLVMHSTFAVNFKQASHQRSIASYPPPDGKMVQLRVYLNSFFHEYEIDVQHRGKHYPPVCSSGTSKSGSDEKTADLPPPASADDVMEKTPYGVTCRECLKSTDFQLQEPPHGPSRPYFRPDTTIESLVIDFNTTVLVELGSRSSVNPLLLVMMHCQMVMLVDEERQGGQVEFQKDISIRHVVRGGSTWEQVLLEIQQRASGKVLLWLSKAQAKRHLKSMLKGIPQNAVIAVDGGASERKLISTLCQALPSWSAHVRGTTLVMAGGRGYHVPKLAYLPPLPRVATASTHLQCHDQKVTVDVVVFTRNRPVQVLSFLDSLSLHLAGVTRVVLLKRSDDPLFDSGYSMVEEYARQVLGLKLKVIQQTGKHFGKLLLAHLKSKDAARYTVFAVDEIVWLRDLDLQQVTCYMEKSDGQFWSAQLRLGNRRDRQGRILDQSRPLASNKEFIALYPYQLPYDWGYILNVDGPLVRTSDLVTDLTAILPDIQNPSQLENTWIMHNLPSHFGQWQLTFDHPHLVNNVLEDGRVLAQATPAEGSLKLARRLVHSDEKVDVRSFISDMLLKHAGTHVNVPVQFMKANLSQHPSASKDEL